MAASEHEVDSCGIFAKNTGFSATGESPMKLPIVFGTLFLLSEAAQAVPLPDTPAPDFNATIVKPDNSDPAGIIVNDFQLSSLFGKKRIMLFAYPKNCTFICPTELLALNKKLDEFKKLDFEVLVISNDEASLKKDAQSSHQAWRNKPARAGEGKPDSPMGIGNVGFSMISDPDHKITKAYGIENKDGMALRATFFIDMKGQVRIADVQSNSIGRDVDGLLRKAAAVKFVEENEGKLVAPEGWQPGDPGMKADHQGVREQMKTKSKD